MDASLLERARAWLDADPDPSSQQQLRTLIDGANEAELADCFRGALEFGTAGLRGVIGPGPNRMNRAVIRRTTAGLARYLKAHVPDVARRGVVIGRDGRTLSPEACEDTARVLAAEGIPAHVFADPVPTPVTAFATLRLGAAAGVMITASHNPPEYNGYKVYWGNGAQIIPPHDSGIAAAIDRVEPAKDVKLMPLDEARAKKLWRDVPEEISAQYLAAISAERLHRQPSSELSIVYTAMHGVGGKWAKRALEAAGFRCHVVPQQQEPDARFPTVRFPNPEEPGAMDLSKALAEKLKADLVLANDPDADRLAVMARDEAGALRMLSGNEVGVLLGHYVLTQKKPAPKRPLVLTTIVSSAQLGQMAHALGALYDETLTGFKWIANRAMEREKSEGASFLFGYEEALGYTVGTVARDKDGIGAALVFADFAAWCRSLGRSVLQQLEHVQREHGLFVSEQKSFTLPGADGAAAIARVMEGFRSKPPTRVGRYAIATARDYQRGELRRAAQIEKLTLPPSNVIAYELDGGSRITLRPSGTEPKIKYYFELKESVAPGEAMDAARTRAKTKMAELIDAFLKLARERGQP